MRLLFDQNLSRHLPALLADLFPGSRGTGELGLSRAPDREVWEAARAGGFALVTFDADFAALAAAQGPPPLVVWLRRGNQPTPAVAALLRARAEAVVAAGDRPDVAVLEVR